MARMDRMLMNPVTGSVAPEFEWRADFARMDLEEWGSVAFEDAGLIEVKWNTSWDWEEVK